MRTKEEELEIVQQFIKKILTNSKDLDPEYAKIVDDHFWELGDENEEKQ